MQLLVDKAIDQYNQQYGTSYPKYPLSSFNINNTNGGTSISINDIGFNIKIDFTESLGLYDSAIGLFYLNSGIPSVVVLVGRRHWLELTREFANCSN